MPFNLQMEGANNGGSETASSSDDKQFLVALRKLRRKETEVMANSIVQQVMRRTMNDKFHNVVKEEIQSTQSSGNRLTTEIIEVMEPIVQQVTRRIMENFFCPVVKEAIQSGLENFLISGNRVYTNEVAVSKERSLQLKFLGEVSAPVLTGKEIQGKRGTPMRVALVDKITEQVVESGPESSAEVEILIVEASNGNDDEHNWSLQNFNNSIIKEGDKKKPHFVESYYIPLKGGFGTLHNAKLAQGSNWMKKCKCRLGARIVRNFSGIVVQEAWTESFMVSDGRREYYRKDETPSLSEDVSILVNISRYGKIRKCLQDNNINTVEHFLIQLFRNQEELKNIANLRGKKWDATVNNARACKKDQRMYGYNSDQQNMGVAFNVLGEVLGLQVESQYIPSDMMSEIHKARAQELLESARSNWETVFGFDDEKHIRLMLALFNDPVTGSEDFSSVSAYNVGNIWDALLSQSPRSCLNPLTHFPGMGCDMGPINELKADDQIAAATGAAFVEGNHRRKKQKFCSQDAVEG